MRTAIFLSTLGFLIAGTVPGLAAPLHIRVEARVTSGTDVEGLFGPADRNLTGEAAIFGMQYDLDGLAADQRVTTASFDRAVGGLLGGVPVIQSVGIALGDGLLSFVPIRATSLQIGDAGGGPGYSVLAQQSPFRALTLGAAFSEAGGFPVSLDQSWSESFAPGLASARLYSFSAPIDFSVTAIEVTPTPVPLPATGLLLAGGLTTAAGLRRTRRRTAI